VGRAGQTGERRGKWGQQRRIRVAGCKVHQPFRRRPLLNGQDRTGRIGPDASPPASLPDHYAPRVETAVSGGDGYRAEAGDCRQPTNRGKGLARRKRPGVNGLLDRSGELARGAAGKLTRYHII
jgi:hypothetical protein